MVLSNGVATRNEKELKSWITTKAQTCHVY